MPLLVFLLVFFLVPLASLLLRRREPRVADALAHRAMLSGWDRQARADAGSRR